MECFFPSFSGEKTSVLCHVKSDFTAFDAGCIELRCRVDIL